MMIHFKLIAALVILWITLLAGFLPFKWKLKNPQLEFPLGEALACGVFLGVGLIDMLGNSAHGFIDLGYHYPFAFLIAGASFLFLLFLEHVGHEMQEYSEDGNVKGMALLATFMLSLHSLFEGAAVGMSGDFLTVLILALAILAHKWAASFSLALQISRTRFRLSTTVLLFLIFAIMTPVGILLGDYVTTSTGGHPLLSPIFSALAAGTFIYIGTLHGLRRAIMIERCCNIREFSMMILGFALIAFVAVWT